MASATLASSSSSFPTASTPTSTSQALNSFFSKFPTFSYNPTADPRSEFDRLARFISWRTSPPSKSYRRAYKAFLHALGAQVELYFYCRGGFVYDAENGPEAEFERLMTLSGWKAASKARKRARQKFEACLETERAVKEGRETADMVGEHPTPSAGEKASSSVAGTAQGETEDLGTRLEGLTIEEISHGGSHGDFEIISDPGSDLEDSQGSGVLVNAEEREKPKALFPASPPPPPPSAAATAQASSAAPPSAVQTQKQGEGGKSISDKPKNAKKGKKKEKQPKDELKKGKKDKKAEEPNDNPKEKKKGKKKSKEPNDETKKEKKDKKKAKQFPNPPGNPSYTEEEQNPQSPLDRFFRREFPGMTFQSRGHPKKIYLNLCRRSGLIGETPARIAMNEKFYSAIEDEFEYQLNLPGKPWTERLLTERLLAANPEDSDTDCGDDDLEAKPWKLLSIVLDLPMARGSKSEFRKSIGRIFVNIYDLIHYMRQTPSFIPGSPQPNSQYPTQPRLFPTLSALAEYSKRKRRLYPLEFAKNSTNLKGLLKVLFRRHYFEP